MQIILLQVPTLQLLTLQHYFLGVSTDCCEQKHLQYLYIT